MNKLILLCAPALILTPSALAQNTSGRITMNAEADAFAIAQELYTQSISNGQSDANRRNLIVSTANRFKDFVSRYPKSSRVPEALFMQANCLLEIQELAEANKILGVLANKHKGDYAATAAYKLASQAFAEKQWAKAAGFYAITMRESKDSDLCNDSRLRMARSYQHLGNTADAEKHYTQLLTTKDVSAGILSASLFSLAQIKGEAGDDANAYKLYLRLLAMDGISDKMRGTSMLQAARLASKIGKEDESLQFYDRLSKMPQMAQYAGEAQMEALHSLYRKKDYKGIVSLISRDYVPLGDMLRESRRTLIIGQAYMELQQFEPAMEWFNIAERSAPDSEYAVDASYRRLLCAQQLRDPNFFTLLENHLKRYAQGGSADSPVNDIVRLMYAERLSLIRAEEKELVQYREEAARQYEAINFNNIPESVRADAMFRKAWLESTIEGTSCLVSLDQFIATYPQHSKIPEALVLRGREQSKLHKTDLALLDFDRTLKDYPNSEAAALACQQAALTCSSAGMIDKMIIYYERLLKDYPKIKPIARAEAHFNLGKAFYQKKQPELAVKNFELAKEIYPEHFAPLVDVNVVQCYFNMRNSALLIGSLVQLERSNIATYKGIPPAILRWCGWRCFEEKDFLNANKYLSDSVEREPLEEYSLEDGSTATRPKVEALIWKMLAKTRLQLGLYESGLEAAKHYISMEKQIYPKVDAMRDQALLLIGLSRGAEAQLVLEEALSTGVDGPLKFSLFIAMGDACYSIKDYTEAAKFYGRSANVVSDPELKAQSLYKIAFALRRAGKEEEALQYEKLFDSEKMSWTPDERTQKFMSSQTP